MTNQQIISLATFALVSSITPGRNNLMLLSSGTNFGFRRTIPHILGVTLGFVFMAIVLGFGLAKVLTRYPYIHNYLQAFCICYLLFLSYKIATTTPKTNNTNSPKKPMSFFQAVLFQWVNPKVWNMTLSTIALYAPSSTHGEILKVILIFGMVNLPSVSIWAVSGQRLRKILSNKARLKYFNYLMATLLISTLYFIV